MGRVGLSLWPARLRGPVRAQGRGWVPIQSQSRLGCQGPQHTERGTAEGFRPPRGSPGWAGHGWGGMGSPGRDHRLSQGLELGHSRPGQPCTSGRVPVCTCVPCGHYCLGGNYCTPFRILDPSVTMWWGVPVPPSRAVLTTE